MKIFEDSSEYVKKCKARFQECLIDEENRKEELKKNIKKIMKISFIFGVPACAIALIIIYWVFVAVPYIITPIINDIIIKIEKNR